MRGWQAICAAGAIGFAMPVTAQAASVTTPALTPTGDAAAAARAIDDAARGPLLQAQAIGGRIERTARLGRALRLRVAVASVTPAPRDHVQQRIASSMVDIFPAGTSGFRLSAGMRLYDQRVGEQATSRGLMTIARQSNIPGGRLGMRRAPVLTLGYTGVLRERTTMGIEVGAMMGHAYNTSAADTTRRLRGERPEGNPVNPMVNVVVGHRF